MKFEPILRKLTTYAQHHTHKISCVIANGNKVISVGVNKIKTHPRSPHPYHMIHAELDAILGCSREELSGATAYIFRQQKNGTPCMSKPCTYCWHFLKECGIKEVVYSCDGTYKREIL